MLVRIFQLLVLCCIAASCCASSCVEYPLNLASATPSNIAGTGADNAQVVSALSELLDERRYWPGTTMCWGGCTGQHDGSRIVPGSVETYEVSDVYPYSSNRAEGTGTRQSGRYMMAFDIGSDHLTLDSDYNTTQKLLNEIKGEHADDVSTSRTTATGSFRGQLAGAPVNLTFDLELRGVTGSGPYF